MATEISTQGDNAFLSYGRAVNQRNIVGQLLKFTKHGEWIVGTDEQEVVEGTQFVPLMDELTVGWCKWLDGKPVEQEAGKIAEGYRPPNRGALSDTDEQQWPYDDRGERRDPWQRTNWLILKHTDSNELLTYSPSSKGGLSAVGSLCETYGKQARLKPDQYPVIELGTSYYKHERYGKLYTPVLKVVGWTSKAEALAALEGAGQENSDDTDAPF